jgi:excinuclease ABC subunit C
MVKSDLDQINGIGPKTKEELLKYFGSVDKIRDASKEQLEMIAGLSKATILWKHFRK